MNSIILEVLTAVIFKILYLNFNDIHKKLK